MSFSRSGAVLLMTVAAFAAPPKKAPRPSEADKKLSYALGQEAGLRAKRMGANVDLQTYFKAFNETLKGKPSSMSKEEAGKLIRDQETEWNKLSVERNKKEGPAFLEANKKKPGVKVTPSSLQYEMLREGTGPHPTAEDTVKAHYRGTLLDGSEFDNSYSRNEPLTFPLKRVIKGWTEGLQLLKVGGKAKFYIPYELAYGEAGRPPVIPPAALLVFEVELLSIEPAPAKK